MERTYSFYCRALRWGMAALLLFVTNVAANAYDFEAVNSDGVTIYYSIISSSENTCEVTYLKYYSSSNREAYSGVVSIPETVTYNETTYSVTEIDGYAFYYCSDVTSVTIPNSVTEIGLYAFYRCTGLTSVTIPNSVTEIGYYAFCGCSGLTSLSIGNSVTEIGGYAFYGCSGLTSVTIPNSVTEIGWDAFSSCTGLTEVTIGESVTEIGIWAFYNCTGLKEVNFNAIACTFAGSSSSNRAFYGCDYISTVSIGDKVTTIPEYTFKGCTGLTNVASLAMTPPTITSSTFEEYVIEYLEVPIGVLIDYATAEYWSNSRKIYAVSNGSEYYPVIISREGNAIVTASVGDENGAEVKAGATATIKPIGSGQISGLVQHGSADITETLNSNGSYSFTVSQYHKENVICSYAISASNTFDLTVLKAGDVLNQVTVANINSVYSLKVTGDINGTDILTIRRMTNLQVLDLSDANVVSGGDNYYNSYSTSDYCVGDYFFYNMTSLRAVKLPSNTKSIGAYAFSGCTGLTSITIPGSVTSIANYAFKGCTGVTSVTMEDGEEELAIGNDKNATPFSDCPFAIVYLGRTLSYDNADYPVFKGKKAIISLTIGSGAKTIGGSAFYGCTGLTSVTIPESVTEIGNYAFYGCSGLTSLSIGNSVTEIGGYAFHSCTGLTSVTIPNSVKTIGIHAFRYCEGLTQITIPSSVVELYWNTFWNCTSLKSLTFEDGENTLSILSSLTSGNYYTAPSFRYCESLYLGRNLSYSNSSSKNEGYYSPFAQVTTLKFVTIRNSVSKIPDYLFYECTGITSLVIGNKVKSIGSSAFYNCSGLTEVKTPNSINSIGSSAFYGCSAMTTLTIGNSCSSIGSNAFDSCSKLRSVYSKAVTPPSISSNTFSGVDKTACTLYIPTGSLNPYWLHVYWTEFFNIVEMHFDDSDDTDPVGRVTANGEAIGYYTLDGKMTGTPQKGINIIRYSDGTARKVLVK